MSDVGLYDWPPIFRITAIAASVDCAIASVCLCQIKRMV
jgi:hypothetical protein